MKVSFLIYLFIFIITLSSCGKKWKQTTDVKMNFDILYSYSPLFKITSCKMNLSEIDFSGDRKQGGSVSFVDTKPTPSSFVYYTGDVSAAMHYDIPQGEYKYIRLHITTASQSATPSISISGTITEPSSIDTLSISPPIYYTEQEEIIPMIFEFNANLVFDLNAITTNGGSEIPLAEGTPATCGISIDPYYWLATITQNQFKKAERDTINGIATIVINETKNKDIYDLIVPRIAGTTKAVFKQ